MAAPATHNAPKRDPVPHRLVATWPAGTFIENISVLEDGGFALSVHNQRKLLRVERDGASRLLADLPVSPAGSIAYGDGVLIVGGEIGRAPHKVYAVGGDGRVKERLAIPDTVFLNGFTPVSAERAYTVDSLKGEIIEIDVAHWTSRAVLADERLGKCSDEPMLPGVNGIKAGEGCLYLTNTDRALVLRADLAATGTVTGLSVVAEALRGDDLALDDAGRLYVTNHIHNTLIRLDPDGSNRVAMAGPDQGMPGCTACAFHPADAGALYVTTTGGVIAPLDGVPQEAKLVRLEVGANGRPLARLA
jgi:sugar lactone lactonase YvrE